MQNKITIINGSTRKKSNSIKIANYLKGELEKKSAESEILDLSEKILPIYDDRDLKLDENKELKNLIDGLTNGLSESQGFIFVSPEWDGMFSVGILNLLHYLDKELADKPVLLITVSSGRGGRYPLLQARAMGYKNKRFVIIPESIFVDFVEKNFIDGKFLENIITERLDYDLNVLLEYAKALKIVRNSGVINYQKYPNGI